MNYNTNIKKYHHINIDERETIAIYLAKYKTNSEIAKKLNRHRTTIWRERKRNSSQKYHTFYRAHRAELKAKERWKATHQKIRLNSDALRKYIIKNLNNDWSPEQIVGRLAIDKPNLHTNHESIYQFIYKERPDLITKLRRSHRIRRKRGSAYNKRTPKVKNRIMIDKRPKKADKRKEPGHWEVDTMISRASKSALLIIHERKSRNTMISKLKCKSAKQVRMTINRRLSRISKKLRKTITFDNGTENTEHEIVSKTLRIKSYFCHPYASWEKGGVENAIGLIRQYFPKKTDLSLISKKDIKIIETKLNNRPRKCLGFKKPKEVFSMFVALVH